MNSISSLELTERIVEKAKLLGATIAGVASVNSLKGSPSHRIYPKNGSYDRVTCNRKMDKDIQDAVIAVPANDEEHAGVIKAIDEFEEVVTIKPQGDRLPNYCVKYCRRCELACPAGE
jgi:hypothetical protein